MPTLRLGAGGGGERQAGETCDRQAGAETRPAGGPRRCRGAPPVWQQEALLACATAHLLRPLVAFRDGASSRPEIPNLGGEQGREAFNVGCTLCRRLRSGCGARCLPAPTGAQCPAHAAAAHLDDPLSVFTHQEHVLQQRRGGEGRPASNGGQRRSAAQPRAAPLHARPRVPSPLPSVASSHALTANSAPCSHCQPEDAPATSCPGATHAGNGGSGW